MCHIIRTLHPTSWSSHSSADDSCSLCEGIYRLQHILSTGWLQLSKIECIPWRPSQLFAPYAHLLYLKDRQSAIKQVENSSCCHITVKCLTACCTDAFAGVLLMNILAILATDISMQKVLSYQGYVISRCVITTEPMGNESSIKWPKRNKWGFIYRRSHCPLSRSYPTLTLALRKRLQCYTLTWSRMCTTRWNTRQGTIKGR